MRSPEHRRFMITIIWLFKMIVTIFEVDMEKLVPLVEMSKGKCIKLKSKVGHTEMRSVNNSSPETAMDISH